MHFMRNVLGWKAVVIGLISLVVILTTLWLDPRVTGLVVTFAIAVITWSLNEWSKRGYDEYKRRENTYLELMRNLRGFYEKAILEDERAAQIARENAIKQLGLCWLYASDEVVLMAGSFLDAVKIEKDQEKLQTALGKPILAIRKDLVGKTVIKPEDFKSFIVTGHRQ